MKTASACGRRHSVSAFLFAAGLASATALASDIRVEGILIWGTNDGKPPSAKLKPVQEQTAEKLRRVFKWKHYFEVNRQTAVIPSRGTNRLVMSKECEVEISELEGPKVAYRLIGKGNPVQRTVAALSKGDSLVVAGSDKNETAWFVLITELDPIKK